MRLAPPQLTETDDDELATLAALRGRWRLPIARTAAILWMHPTDVRRWDADEAAPVQSETLSRLALLDDIDLSLAAHVGPEMAPFWLRMPNAALDAAPPDALGGPTAGVRQLRWHLRGELADRREAGVAE